MRAAGSPLQVLLAVTAVLTYAAAVLWLHHVQKSTWRVEQLGPLVLSASYLFYDKPFGSLDGGLGH